MDQNKNLIPKVLHYCWLSGDPYPRKIRKCLDTWRRVMPDYRLRLWDISSFDIESVPFVAEAVKARKWAFAADYIRMHALYTEGGIYLDSDVKILKRFDDFLDNDFFSSVEHHPTQMERDGAYAVIDSEGHRTADAYVSGMQIQAAVMGARPGNAFVKDVLDWYADKHFILADGTMALDPVSPQIYARLAEPYGYLYVDRDMQLDAGIRIYPSEIFAGNRHEATSRSYAIHLCAHSWHATPSEKVRAFVNRLMGR